MNTATPGFIDWNVVYVDSDFSFTGGTQCIQAILASTDKSYTKPYLKFWDGTKDNAIVLSSGDSDTTKVRVFIKLVNFILQFYNIRGD